MFGNSFFKTILLVITLSLQINCFAASSWKKGKVRRIVGPQHVQLFDGQIFRIAGLHVPDKFNKDDPDYCYARKTARLLKFLLEDKEIQFLIPKQKHSFIPQAYVKQEKQDISKFLIERGLARFQNFPEDDRYNKIYQKAETQAQKGKKGLWKGCNNQSLPFLRKHSQARRAYRKKFTPFLANISVGTVTRVLSGTQIALENGLRVRLIGVESPSPKSLNPAHACFGKVAQKYLENLLLGRKVYLRKDFSQFNEQRELLRYVFLDPKSKTFVNKNIIEKGFGKQKIDSQNKWFQKELEEAESQIKQNYTGAWKICKNFILADE